MNHECHISWVFSLFQGEIQRKQKEIKKNTAYFWLGTQYNSKILIVLQIGDTGRKSTIYQNLRSAFPLEKSKQLVAGYCVLEIGVLILGTFCCLLTRYLTFKNYIDMGFCQISSKNVYNFGSLKLYVQDLGIIPQFPKKQMTQRIDLWSLVLLKLKTFRTRSNQRSLFFKKVYSPTYF